MTDRVGQQLGHYRLVRLLGRGGFAEVYLGEHLRLKTQVAVKILHTSLEDEDVEGFLREAQTVAHLKHSHIVRVFDFDVENHTPYLVMDYLPNGNVRRFHPRGSALPLATIVSYAQQVASALHYAHDQKLIHRDVKPENMLLDRDNTIVLSDFGIALMAQSSRYQSTQEVAGTAAYMAPEQFQGKPRRASDQYALGVVVYEWLTGDRPFHGSFSEIASQHLFVPPPPLREKVPVISSEVEQVVLIALEKDPYKRFASIQAFARALEQAYQRVSSTTVALPSESIPQSQPLPSTDVVVATSPVQASQPKDMVTPPSQSPRGTNATAPISQPLQPSEVAIPPHASVTLPPLTRVSVSSGNSWASKHQVSRRAVVICLVGLTGVSVVGGSIAWLANSQKPQVFSPSSTDAPTATPSPSALGTTLYTYSGHKAGMRALAWSLDSKRVATASDDYTAQVWDATTGGNATIYRGHSSYVEGVAWSPDQTLIVSGSADGTAQIWNATTGSHIYTYRGHIYTYPGSANQDHPWVNRVGWSLDGKHIVSCDQTSDSSRTATVQVWEATTGKTIITYRGHTNGVYAVAWSPDRSRIASAGYDGTLQIWEATSGNTVATYGGSAFLFGLSWSPDSKYVAVGSSDAIVLIVEAASGSVQNTYSGHSNWVKDVAWSPDGKYIASGSDDGTVILWDTATGTNFYTYNGHSGHVNAVGWSLSSKLIASGGDTVQVWQGS
jgi:eukaryotic-like serine/threonine-protein kinase